MSRRFVMRLAMVPGVLLVLALLFWLLLPLFISTDFVRSAIERQFTELAGQRVAIGDTTNISLFPTPSARLENVVIRPGFDRPGQDGDAVATITAIDVEMPLGSIITGNPRFSSIHLIKPVIRLQTSSEQSLLSQLPMQNVVAAVRIANTQREQQTTEDANIADRADIAINYPDWLNMTVGTISFEDGSIVLVSDGEATDSPFSIEQAEGQLIWPRIDQPLALTSDLLLNGELVSASYRTDDAIAALGGEITNMTLEATSELGTLQFSGNAGLTAGFYAFGDVRFETQSLRNLLRWRGDDVRPALGLGAISLTAAMQTRGQTVRLDDLTLDIGGNTGTGVIEFRDDEDAPIAVIGTLDFATLELRDFFGAFVSLPRNATSRRNIDTRFMDQLQADLRISAAQATFGELALENVAATAQTTQEIALFDVGYAEAFGGTLQARLRLDRGADNPVSEFSIAGEQVSFDLARQALDLPALLPNGVADFSVDLTSPLSDWRSLLSTPNGQMSLRMAQGNIAGFDAEVLGNVYAFGNFSAMDMSDTGTAAFQSLVWTSAINNGELRLDDLTIDYGTGLYDFSGVLQMDNRSLALTLTHGLPVETGPETPQRFFIGGGIDAPYIYPVVSSQPL